MVALGVTACFGLNLATGFEGDLFPFSSYPMFSDPLPPLAARHLVEVQEADGTVVATLPFGAMFNPSETVWSGIGGRVARDLAQRAAEACPAEDGGSPRCIDGDATEAQREFTAVRQQWDETMQARSGLEEDYTYTVVRESRPVTAADWDGAERTPLFTLTPGVT